jgi:integral membrane protein
VFRTPLSAFRLLAFAEAVTWTLLISALILRATVGWAPAVTIAGGVHGFVFLSYGATAILVALNNRWPAGSTALAIVSAVIPYATIPVERWLVRRGRLDGHWRTNAGDGHGDARWYDGPLRWFLRRPWVLVLLIVAAVTALFVVLLVVGPPGGR